jgi:hypothetical protein
MKMICSTCDANIELSADDVLLDDRNGIQIWRVGNVAHVFHRQKQVEVAEVNEQQD